VEKDRREDETRQSMIPYDTIGYCITYLLKTDS